MNIRPTQYPTHNLQMISGTFHLYKAILMTISLLQTKRNAKNAQRPCRNWKTSTMKQISWESVSWKSTMKLWLMNIIWDHCQSSFIIDIKHQLFMRVGIEIQTCPQVPERNKLRSLEKIKAETTSLRRYKFGIPLLSVLDNQSLIIAQNKGGTSSWKKKFSF